MGATLSVVGAGGSILAIPILVYAFKVPVTLATTYSLAIVGVCATLGVLRSYQSLSLSKAVAFFMPSLLGVYSVRAFVVPYLPPRIGLWSVDVFLLMCLVIMMWVASYFMIRDMCDRLEVNDQRTHTLTAMILGFFVGGTTGLLGTGGGFLIIPSLVLLLKMEMKQAVVTSLFVIALNCLVGVASSKNFLWGDVSNLGIYMGLSLLGVFIGARIGQNLQDRHLKKGFGYFVMIVATCMFIKEIFLKG